MLFHRKLWVPKFTYSACVDSKEPPVLLIALFLWTSIVLMIGLQWKKDKKRRGRSILLLENAVRTWTEGLSFHYYLLLVN